MGRPHCGLQAAGECRRSVIQTRALRRFCGLGGGARRVLFPASSRSQSPRVSNSSLAPASRRSRPGRTESARRCRRMPGSDRAAPVAAVTFAESPAVIELQAALLGRRRFRKTGSCSAAAVAIERRRRVPARAWANARWSLLLVRTGDAAFSSIEAPVRASFPQSSPPPGVERCPGVAWRRDAAVAGPSSIRCPSFPAKGYAGIESMLTVFQLRR